MRKNKSKRIAVLAAFVMLLTMLSVPMTGYAAEGDVLKYKTGSDSNSVHKGSQFEKAAIVNDDEAEDTEAYTIQCSDILEVGERQNLEVFDDNDSKYEGNITWVSPNTDIASIDADGTMAGHAKGVVTIKAIVEGKEITTEIGVGHFPENYDTNEDGFIAYDFNTKLGISTKDDFYRLKKKWASVDLSNYVYMTVYDQKTKKSKIVDPSQYKAEFSTNDTNIIDVTPKGKVTAKTGVGNATVTLTAKYKGKTYEDDIIIDIEDYTTVDDLLYALDRDTKEATLDTVPPDCAVSTIPSTISVEQEKYNVVAIGTAAFYYCEELKEMTIPEGVKTIGDRAFYQCTNLKNIKLPDSLESIGEMAIGYLQDDEDNKIDKNLVIHCSHNNKVAIDYAKTNGLKINIEK